ncbi:hypothetical protein FB451DRAFT_1415486 [Mycena latifolia]|nr:hypothetical protein FB451DRAFT_1415486 [Mycena latifolia]
MPKLKRKTCTNNLGDFAKKKPKLDDNSSTTSGSSCSGSPEGSPTPSISDSTMDIAPDQSDKESEVLLEDSALSEALDDIPVFESESGLLRWLEVGKQRFKAILSKIKDKTMKGEAA